MMLYTIDDDTKSSFGGTIRHKEKIDAGDCNIFALLSKQGFVLDEASWHWSSVHIRGGLC